MSNILPKSSQARKKTPPDTLGFEHRYCLGNRRWKAALVWKNKQGVYNVQFYSHETILSAIRQPCGSESGDSPNREHYKYEGLSPFPAMRQRCEFFFILFFLSHLGTIPAAAARRFHIFCSQLLPTLLSLSHRSRTTGTESYLKPEDDDSLSTIEKSSGILFRSQGQSGTPVCPELNYFQDRPEADFWSQAQSEAQSTLTFQSI